MTVNTNSPDSAPDTPDVDDTNRMVANNIEVEMLRRGMKTVPTLTELLNHHPSTIRKKLQSISTFDVAEVGRVAAHLGIDPAKLFEHDDALAGTR